MTIDIKNLTFGYDNLLFDRLDLTIHDNTFTSILGKNGCGKSTLIKILIGDLDYSGQIKYNNIILDNETKEDIRQNISVITDYNNMFLFDDVYSDIVFSLEKSGYILSIVDDIINSVSKDLDLVYLLHKKTSELSDSEKQLAILLCMIVNKPSILILDDSLNNIDLNKKKDIISYLKNQNITVINITNNVEDILLSDEVVIINNKKCISTDNIIELLDNDNLFIENNLKLPFMADLSKKLIYYELLDKIVLDKNELVDLIWK